MCAAPWASRSARCAGSAPTDRRPPPRHPPSPSPRSGVRRVRSFPGSRRRPIVRHPDPRRPWCRWRPQGRRADRGHQREDEGEVLARGHGSFLSSLTSFVPQERCCPGRRDFGARVLDRSPLGKPRPCSLPPRPGRPRAPFPTASPPCPSAREHARDRPEVAALPPSWGWSGAWWMAGGRPPSGGAVGVPAPARRWGIYGPPGLRR